MSDIERKMAEWRKNLWGTGPRPDSSQENFTLTDAEREAVERAAQWMVQLAKDRGEIHSAGYFVDDAATLRGLLERL